MINNIPVYLGKANSVFNIYLKDEIAKIAGAKYLEMTGKEIMDKTADLTKKSVSDNMPPVEGDFGAMLSYHLVHTDFFKEQIISRLAETLEMDENMTREVLDVKIQNLFEEGVLNAIIEQQLRNIFGTLKLNFLLVFFVVLCLAIAEIALANYWEKKKQEKSQTPQG